MNRREPNANSAYTAGSKRLMGNAHIKLAVAMRKTANAATEIVIGPIFSPHHSAPPRERPWILAMARADLEWVGSSLWHDLKSCRAWLSRCWAGIGPANS